MLYITEIDKSLQNRKSDSEEQMLITSLQFICLLVGLAMFVFALLMLCQWLAQILVGVLYVLRNMIAEKISLSGLERRTDNTLIEEIPSRVL